MTSISLKKLVIQMMMNWVLVGLCSNILVEVFQIQLQIQIHQHDIGLPHVRNEEG